MPRCFPAEITWPNGRGFTPCSQAYADALAQQEAICDLQTGGIVDELSPEDYERWHRLENALLTMQASGEHLGKSETYV